MTKHEIKWKRGTFKKFRELTLDAIRLALEYTATGVWGEVRKKAPVDHGRLAGSFELSQTGDLSWRISSNVKYALMVHEGTGIYGPRATPIVPVRAKRLVFFWKKTGKMMYLPSVEGMKGRPYIDWAIKEVEPRVSEFAQRAIRETMKNET